RASDVPGSGFVALLDEVVGEDGDESGGQRTACDNAEDGIGQGKGINKGIGLMRSAEGVGEEGGAGEAQDATEQQGKGDDGGGASEVAGTQRLHLRGGLVV